MNKVTQSHYDATIIGMYRGGATVYQISDATFESCDYVWKVLDKYFSNAIYKAKLIEQNPTLN